MFADFFTLKLGDETVKGRRLTLGELRDKSAALQAGTLSAEECAELVRKHVTLLDGSPIDPYELTPGQLRQLVAELVLPKEGRGIADFIGLLS